MNMDRYMHMPLHEDAGMMDHGGEFQVGDFWY